MVGKLNNRQSEVIISEQMIGRFVCHYNDLTYVVPISYTYNGGCIYCITYEGMKLDIMRKNPKVCLEIDELIDMANWKSVICWGEFEELLISPQHGPLLIKMLINLRE